MELETIITPLNGTYWVQFSLPACGQPISGAEQDMLRRFGDLLVEFGGDFDNNAGLAFALPSNMILVPLQLPLKQAFDPVIYGTSAVDAAALYINVVKNRIREALAVLHARTTGDIGRTVTNLSPSSVPSPSNAALEEWLEL